MNIEVGMYVKFKNGNIAKLIEIEDEYPQTITKYKFDNIIGYITVSQYYYPKYISSCYASEIEDYIRNDIKPSFNIKDLIEVGDYVNGREVIDIKMKCDETIKCLITKGYDITNEMIKSIVTKEQFKSSEYVVE
jgi:hypothetical protein